MEESGGLTYLDTSAMPFFNVPSMRENLPVRISCWIAIRVRKFIIAIESRILGKGGSLHIMDYSLKYLDPKDILRYQNPFSKIL